MKAGKVVEVRATSEKGGDFRLENPFSGEAYRASGIAGGKVQNIGLIIEADMRPGEQIRLTAR